MTNRFGSRPLMVVAAIGATLALVPTSAEAVALRMDYTYTDIGGGLNDYEFTLTLDNNDGSYVSGQGWAWVVFGDVSGAPTNLTNFVGDMGDMPAGPWTGYTSSGGGHNGPTLSGVTAVWTPTGIGDSVFWSGTSDASLGEGDLFWSTLISDGSGSVKADFEHAHYNPVPEPATMSVLALGAVALVRRRRKPA